MHVQHLLLKNITPLRDVKPAGQA